MLEIIKVYLAEVMTEKWEIRESQQLFNFESYVFVSELLDLETR